MMVAIEDDRVCTAGGHGRFRRVSLPGNAAGWLHPLTPNKVMVTAPQFAQEHSIEGLTSDQVDPFFVVYGDAIRQA